LFTLPNGEEIICEANKIENFTDAVCLLCLFVVFAGLLRGLFNFIWGAFQFDVVLI
jgi:hypothetical protein